MASTYNITATQGSTLLLNVTAQNADSSYINFNGYTARGYVKYSYSSSGNLLNLNAQVHPSYISGLITLSGSAEAMSAMPVGIFVYDIEASGNNYVFKPIRGYFEVSPEVST